MYIVDDTPAIFDLWVLGDDFTRKTFGQFEEAEFNAQSDATSPPLYIHEFFNVKVFENCKPAGVELAAARIVNSLIDAINSENKLPKILLVTIDKDIATDVCRYDPATQQTMLQELTQWCVQQINMIIRRKRLDLLEKRPGAIAGHATTIIFVRMMRRIGNHKIDSKTGRVLEMRSKFNDALNNSVGKIGQHILTVTSCNSYDHFSHNGDLSLIGKSEFRWKLTT